MINVLELHEEFKHAPFDTFDTLKADNYLKDKHVFRYRAYNICAIYNHKLNWNSDSYFLQSEKLNSYAGGVARKFDPLPTECKKYIELIIYQLINSSVIPDNNYKIGCHQIRISSTDDFNGYPAPEGFHQDGFDYVAIHCVSLNNVNGAISLVRPLVDKNNLKEHILMPGQIMVLDDREVEHYITPITPKLPGSAYRDIFVITFSKIKD
ncbi:2OG-Fe dioxygenase family protein [Xenorhabdus khoisanae]|uniref:2OG-Fe dioxygenase family protein n=1 Tax=Xenorhabdus khoisanae TaxID=880157 RepID=UPI0023595C85|nr:2OG-Fe dioxygenase family protein [Xenorhabdus khoisanae]MDC9616078.1 2OG-Fe dioxygenase family protein [Xenorhabdus khoisanae]